MSEFITQAFVEQFESNVTILSQQQGSVLAPYIRTKDVTGTEWNAEQLGATAARKRTSRHQDSPLVATPHSRRKGYVEDWEWGDMVDDEDEVRTLISPVNPYAINAGWAMGRVKDNLIISAATGYAYDHDGTQIALPAAQKVAVDAVAPGSSAANSNLTTEKLIRAKSILGKGNVPDTLPRFLVHTQAQLDAMLRQTDVTSADYAAVKALVNGEINYWMGFTWIRTELLSIDSSSIRTCFAFVGGPLGGLEVGIGMNRKTRISERADKGYNTYVYMKETLGAVRTEDAKVVQILCDETA